MKDRLPLLLILAFFSCKMTEQNIADNYRDPHNFENSILLQPNQDESYEFKQQSGLVFFNTKGDWNVDKDTLRLVNKDTSMLNGTSISQQAFLIKGTKLIEVSGGKLTELKLKRS